MIKIGSTMTLESWDRKYKDNLDWNHAWGTAPTNIISRNMWGVIPVGPGFCEAEIFPQLEGVNFSEITVPTIKSSISAKFNEQGNGNQVYEILIPKSIKTYFKLPKKRYKEILVNGRSHKNKNRIVLKKEHNIVEIKY
jgi:hypothetical protein